MADFTLLDVGLILFFAAVFYMIWEQIWVYKHTKSIPGPKWVLPIIGQTISMIWTPWQFYEKQGQYGPVSWNSLGGQLVYYLTDNDLIRKVFMNQEGKLRLFLIFGAEKILGSNNIAFMHGPEHVALRKQLLPLFTTKALSTYLTMQERHTREKLEKLLARTAPEQVRTEMRDLILETSCEVFVGTYLTEAESADMAEAYLKMNDGLLCIPIAYPGGTQWKAIQARKKVVSILEKCVELAKVRMADDAAPTCLLDFWMEEQRRLEKTGETVEFTDTNKIACTVLDFLFASQDATTSALTWLLALVDQHPEVFEKIKEEQLRLRPNDEPLTQELLEQMEYTRQVVHENLRFRVPTTMMPHVAAEEYKLTKDVTVPKGSVLMGSIYESHFQGFTDAHKFDPERWGSERAEDIKHGKYFLPFGTGPHMCLGRQYAVNQQICFLAVFCRNSTWTRTRTPISDEIIFTPTLMPADNCILSFQKSEHYQPTGHKVQAH